MCLIARYVTYRRAGVIYRPEPAGSLPGRHSVLDRWERDDSPAGGEPPARSCWSLPGGRSGLDRWERDDSPGRG